LNRDMTLRPLHARNKLTARPLYGHETCAAST